MKKSENRTSKRLSKLLAEQKVNGFTSKIIQAKSTLNKPYIEKLTENNFDTIFVLRINSEFESNDSKKKLNGNRARCSLIAILQYLVRLTDLIKKLAVNIVSLIMIVISLLSREWNIIILTLILLAYLAKGEKQ